MAVRWNTRALRELSTSGEIRELLDDVGKAVAQVAQRNASPIVNGDRRRLSAINHEVSSDAQGSFVDVGYTRGHPGFVLWWHEVGTINHPPSPHLRPAACPATYRTMR